MKNRLAAIVSVLALALLLQGCGTLISLNALHEYHEPIQKMDEVIVTAAPRPEALQKWSDEFALMALFAKVVYRKDLAEKVRVADGCAYLGASAPAPDFGMPKGTHGAWTRLNEKHIDSCYNGRGLYYETYVHSSKPDSLPDEAVIAIRGTENWNFADSFKDWKANFSAALGIEPSEYKLAREKIRVVIKSLIERNKRIKIYVTGHSLGGGIAQQMAYVSKHISAAYAFNPSPVTNWSVLMQIPGAIKTPDPKIYRVYHSNEGLAYVRNITTRFNVRRFGRSDYEFFFQVDPPIKAHEMGVLACHFAARIGPSGAKHDFPKKFADEILASDYKRLTDAEQKKDGHPVCSNEIADLPLPYDTSKITGKRE